MTDSPWTNAEFHRTTQYGTKYVIGRNCRFLQGPKTNPFSIRRIREKLEAGKEHYETFLNYRRDGSPFMNLLMCTPLMDSKGTVRYFLGAQVDVSGLAKECAGLEYLKRYIDSQDGSDSDEQVDEKTAQVPGGRDIDKEAKDEFQELSEMFNLQELDTVRRHGGAMYRPLQGQEQTNAPSWPRERVVIESDSDGDGYRGDMASPDDTIVSPAAPQPSRTPWAQEDAAPAPSLRSRPSTPADKSPLNRGGNMPGAYKNYLLVRPYPSLRILFASPSLRIPGILQSSLMERVGGSGRVRDQVQQALADGRRVTAKIRWVSSPRRNAEYSRPRWIHATPLLGSNGGVGVWMVIIVDDDDEDVAGKSIKQQRRQRRFGLSAPPLEVDAPRLTP